MFFRHCSALRHSHVFINDQQLTDFQLPTMWPYRNLSAFFRVQIVVVPVVVVVVIVVVVVVIAAEVEVPLDGLPILGKWPIVLN